MNVTWQKKYIIFISIKLHDNLIDFKVWQTLFITLLLGNIENAIKNLVVSIPIQCVTTFCSISVH